MINRFSMPQQISKPGQKKKFLKKKKKKKKKKKVKNGNIRY